MKKKIALICTAVVLVAAIAVGGTLALLTDQTDPVQNTFTVGKGISIDLKEPAWDGEDFDGNTSTASEDLGENLAQNFVPSRVIPKDPTVKNTSDMDAVWIAVKLDVGYNLNEDGTTYQVTGKDALDKIQDFAKIDWNNGWEEKDTDNSLVYYYKTTVAAGAETANLFSEVAINNDANEQGMDNFKIDVTAYAVQAENVEYEAAKTALDDLMAQVGA